MLMNNYYRLIKIHMEYIVNNISVYPLSYVNCVIWFRWFCCRKRNLMFVYCFLKKHRLIVWNCLKKLQLPLIIMLVIIGKLANIGLPWCIYKVHFNYNGNKKIIIALLILI
jgi:hypothetical protein